jgi:catalase (peroxidase I)
MKEIAAAGLTGAQPISPASAASRFRGGDTRGDANRPRIRHRPQRNWEVSVHMHAGMP